MLPCLIAGILQPVREIVQLPGISVWLLSCSTLHLFRGLRGLHPGPTFAKSRAGNAETSHAVALAGHLNRAVAASLRLYENWESCRAAVDQNGNQYVFSCGLTAAEGSCYLLSFFQPFTQWLTGLAACLYLMYMPIVLFSISPTPLPLFKSLRHLWDPPPQRKTRKPIERLSDRAKWPLVAPRVSSVCVCGCSLSGAFTVIRAFELKIHLRLLFYLSPSYGHTYKKKKKLLTPSPPCPFSPNTLLGYITCNALTLSHKSFHIIPLNWPGSEGEKRKVEEQWWLQRCCCGGGEGGSDTVTAGRYQSCSEAFTLPARLLQKALNGLNWSTQVLFHRIDPSCPHREAAFSLRTTFMRQMSRNLLLSSILFISILYSR